MSHVYDNLRDANKARQIEWDKKGDMTLSYSGNELAGETGELIEAVAEVYYGGGQVGLEAMKQEIGDVIICCDLIAARLDFPLNLSPVLPHHQPIDTPSLLLDIGIDLGRICNIIKKLERESFGMVGSTASLVALQDSLDFLVRDVFWLARYYGFDAGQCAAAKFNKTSEKYGLATRMVTHG